MTFPSVQVLTMAVAAAMLAAAVWHDVRYRRIPNAAVLGGTLAGFALAGVPGGIGVVSALGGMAAGFAVLLPLYLMRVTGAGDVKLMAAMGALAGWPAIVGIVLASFIAGGVLSLALALRLRVLPGVLRNLRTAAVVTVTELASGRLPDGSGFPVTSARMPYAIAIAAGAAAYCLLAASGSRGIF
jgi:prepilin peptidase CpaA